MDSQIKSLNNKFINLFIGSFFISLIISGLLWYFGQEVGVNYLGIAAASRALTGFFGALLGAMVFIISLTSTTYTPKITDLFLNHPIAGSGLALIIFGQLLLIAGALFGEGHAWHDHIMTVTVGITFLTTTMILPYLYYLVHFINPKFFLPIIKNNILKDINRLHQEKTIHLKIERGIFTNFDTLMNVASTAAKKDDKQLMMSIIDMAHEILFAFVENQGKEKFNWRINNPQFISGISEEGKFVLEKRKDWPEFYIIGKIMRLILNLDKSQNEVISHVCERFLEVIDECAQKEKEDILELLVMTFNTLLRNSIQTKNLERFQAVSYHYRLMIELLFSNIKARDIACERLARYADLSAEEGFIRGTETILYDIGRIIIFYAYEDEQYGIDFLESFATPLWNKFIDRKDKLGEMAWKSIVKAYWEVKAKGFAILPRLMFERYLQNNKEAHKSALESLFMYTNTLHWEYNDRLINMTNLTAKSSKIAHDYYSRNFKKNSKQTA